MQSTSSSSPVNSSVPFANDNAAINQNYWDEWSTHRKEERDERHEARRKRRYKQALAEKHSAMRVRAVKIGFVALLLLFIYQGLVVMAK